MKHNGAGEKYYGRCPKCASKEVQRSRRKNFFERALGPIALPWRCSVCYARFFRPFWFKAEPRRMELSRHFQKTTRHNEPPSDARARTSLFRLSKQTLPGFIQRNPALAFLIPTRRQVGNVQNTVPFSTK